MRRLLTAVAPRHPGYHRCASSSRTPWMPPRRVGSWRYFWSRPSTTISWPRVGQLRPEVTQSLPVPSSSRYAPAPSSPAAGRVRRADGPRLVARAWRASPARGSRTQRGQSVRLSVWRAGNLPALPRAHAGDRRRGHCASGAPITIARQYRAHIEVTFISDRGAGAVHAGGRPDLATRLAAAGGPQEHGPGDASRRRQPDGRRAAAPPTRRPVPLGFDGVMVPTWEGRNEAHVGGFEPGPKHPARPPATVSRMGRHGSGWSWTSTCCSGWRAWTLEGYIWVIPQKGLTSLCRCARAQRSWSPLPLEPCTAEMSSTDQQVIK